MSPGVISLGTSLFFFRAQAHAITIMNITSAGDHIFTLYTASAIAYIALIALAVARKS